MVMKYDLNKKWYSDLSLWSLLAANIFSIIVGIVENWNLIIILWIYWGQNIVIGIFNFKKMWLLENEQKNNPLSFEQKTQGIRGKSLLGHLNHLMSLFFLIHYGGFHFGYFIFLIVFSVAGDTMGFGNASAHSTSFGFGFLFVVIGIGVFLAHHWYSFNSNKKKGTLFGSKKPSLSSQMFKPYARIIPMHIIIVIGIWISSSWQLLLFLILKTIADLVMHRLEHK